MKKTIFLILSFAFGVAFDTVAKDGDALSIFRNNGQLTGYIEQPITANPQFKWRKQLPSLIESMPVSDGKLILLGGSDKKIYCLNAGDGSEKWSASLTGISEAPITLYNDSALVCTDNNMVYRLSLDTGKIIWEYKTGGKMAGAVNVWTKDNDILLLAGCYDYKVYCINYSDGSEKWQAQAENYINGSISISDNTAAFGSCDGFVYFLDLAGGKISGKYDTGAYVPGWPVLHAGLCYSGNYEGRVTAVSTSDAGLKWEYKMADGLNIMDGPALGPSQILLADETDSLYCLNKNDGKELWKFKADKPLSAPVICGEKIFCGSENGWLYMLDLADGKIAWKYLVGEELSEPAYVNNNMLLFTDNSGRIYCFSLK